MVKLFKYPAAGFLIFTLLAGFIILYPQISCQGYLSTGDHGRDLYAFEHAYYGARSAVPYRDYWWVYGPLSPYYYGLFIKLFGAKISSVLIGQVILLLAAGSFLFLTIIPLAGPLAAIAASLWFFSAFQDFFFTYNHTAGIACLMALAFSLTSYTRTQRRRYSWGAMAAVFLLLLIKLNQGIAAMLTTTAVILILNHLKPGKKNPLFWPAFLIGIPVITAIIYFLLLNGLSIDEIRECFPYTNADQQYISTPWLAMLSYAQIWIDTLYKSPRDLFLAGLFFFSAGRLIQITFQKTKKFPQKKTFLSAITVLALLWIAVLHEYLKSGVTYRFAWSQPVWMIILFITCATAFKTFKQKTKTVLWILLTTLILTSAASRYTHVTARKTSTHFLSSSKAEIFTANDSSWISAVEQTAAFINKTLKPDEQFLALPYDPLYYFLTSHDMPTRQSIFFEHIHIPPTQERAIIADLERKHVNWIVLSNRYTSKEAGLGTLGQDYCPLIANYIETNYKAVARFGSWTHSAGWGWSHGTVILRRKPRHHNITAQDRS